MTAIFIDVTVNELLQYDLAYPKDIEEITVEVNFTYYKGFSGNRSEPKEDPEVALNSLRLVAITDIDGKEWYPCGKQKKLFTHLTERYDIDYNYIEAKCFEYVDDVLNDMSDYYD